MFTKENFNQILSEIEVSPKSLKEICDKFGTRKECFFKFLNAASQEDKNRYARSKDVQCDLIAEDMIEIADDKSEDTIIKTNEATGETYEIENKEWVNRSRLRIDTRKWVLAKLKPKKFGDRVDVEHSGTIQVISHIPDERPQP